jgi:hypothetical protein
MRLPETPNHYTFTQQMATAVFAETLGNFKHSVWLIPENKAVY